MCTKDVPAYLRAVPPGLGSFSTPPTRTEECGFWNGKAVGLRSQPRGRTTPTHHCPCLRRTVASLRAPSVLVLLSTCPRLLSFLMCRQAVSPFAAASHLPGGGGGRRNGRDPSPSSPPAAAAGAAATTAPTSTAVPIVAAPVAVAALARGAGLVDSR